jgi:hypothetical protein
VVGGEGLDTHVARIGREATGKDGELFFSMSKEQNRTGQMGMQDRQQRRHLKCSTPPCWALCSAFLGTYYTVGTALCWIGME